MSKSIIDLIWELVDVVASKTNCKKRAVGCIIYNHEIKEIVGIGYNSHEHECDCKNKKTALHAEMHAIASIQKSEVKENLIAYINHKPCDNCHKALKEVVHEVRYRFQ